MKEARSVFKFATSENAHKLLHLGNIYIPYIKEFSDSTKYNGKIYDNEEGTYKLKNTYDSFVLTPNTAFGAAYTRLNTDENRMVSGVLELVSSVEKGHIYCTAAEFFSDTLQFSVEENKTSCVFITDFEKFNETVNQSIPYADFLDAASCDYRGRVFTEHNPDKNSISHQLVTDNHLIYFLKPEKYYLQNEIRAVWIRNDGSIAPINEVIPELKQYCIEVKFEQIYDLIKRNKRLEDEYIGCRFHLKDGGESQSYFMRGSNAIFSPAVSYEEEKPFLWFKVFAPEPGTINRGLLGNGNVHIRGEIRTTSEGTDIGNYDLSKVSSIEYFIKDDY